MILIYFLASFDCENFYKKIFRVAQSWNHASFCWSKMVHLLDFFGGETITIILLYPLLPFTVEN